MSAPQGMVSFSGVDAILEAAVVVGHGISPCAAVLKIAPQPSLAIEVGTLELTYGDTTVTLRDCKVDYAAIERNDRGEIWRLTLLDRRWRWRYGSISGRYNLRRDDSTLVQGQAQSVDTERTPQELAILLLDAMGETDYLVDDLPNGTRPRVEWDGAVPADALAELCEQLGCRVVLQLDDRVALRRTGQGADLPAGELLEDSVTLDAPPRPSELAVACGPNRYQVDFRLEAVGLEEGDSESTDTLVPIDALSYRPAAGWSRVDLPYFYQVDSRFRGLAQRSVFRYYRIQIPVAVAGYDGPSGNEVSSLEQILPIEVQQVAVVVESGDVVSRPATVHGVWFPDQGAMTNSTTTLVPAPQPTAGDGGTALMMFYQGGFWIDAARGLVVFDEPVYRNVHASAGGSGGFELVIAPAQLVLRTACRVRDAGSLAPRRHVRRRSTGAAASGGTRYLLHDEIVLTHTPQYSASYSIAGVDTNLSAVNSAADAILDAAMIDDGDNEARVARYVGLVAIELDGAIRQVGFHVERWGATTTVERNTQRPGLGAQDGERRAIERSRVASAAVARWTANGSTGNCQSTAHSPSRP